MMHHLANELGVLSVLITFAVFAGTVATET